jgi:hypothetical protein
MCHRNFVRPYAKSDEIEKTFLHQKGSKGTHAPSFQARVQLPIAH